MGIGVGIFLIAVGAILTFAVNATTSGVNVDAVKPAGQASPAAPVKP